MGSRQRAIDTGIARGRALTATLLAELRQARLDRGLAGAEVARVAGISPAQYSRIERGLTSSVSIRQLSGMLAAVGLDLSARAFPAGEPLRDAAHVALLERLRRRVGPSARFMTEVPFPSPNDRRAWDAVVAGAGWRHGIEAETRPRDRQALERRLALKLRDGDVTSMSLLLLDSRHNRDFVRGNSDVFRERFPQSGRRALELLAVGVNPGANSIILL
ncbi:MAG TPA: helix-turn-helix transcriptional regulator [Candidatus Limnocylindrales bacterium]|nr:helix-turn-helix transcriptional regulator [Candidatus Limnocylindrales bacterium]